MILFIYSWEREKETQAEGEAGSTLGSRRGTRSRVSRITPWTKGRRSTTESPRDPLIHSFQYQISRWLKIMLNICLFLWKRTFIGPFVTLKWFFIFMIFHSVIAWVTILVIELSGRLQSSPKVLLLVCRICNSDPHYCFCWVSIPSFSV